MGLMGGETEFSLGNGQPDLQRQRIAGMINLLWSGFIFMLLLSGCGWNDTPTRNNDFIPLTSIEIVAVPATIAAHTSIRISAKGNFSGFFTRDITDQAVWSSDAPNVAEFITAASPSRVTGHIPGTATLTATVGKVSATFLLNISTADITALTITPVDPSIAKGLNTQFAARGTFSDLTSQDLTFDAAWASSVPVVAAVSDAPGSKGLAQALTIGTSTITATFEGIITTKTGSTLLTVTEPLLQSITLLPANPSILTLSIASFKATGHYSDGTTPDISSLVTWSSSSANIATIATGGVATTLSQGTTSVSATLNGVSGKTNLKATGGNLTGFTASPAVLTMVSNTLVRMTATGSFSNGSTRDITGVVVWSTADPALATVSEPVGNLVLLNAKVATPASIPTKVTATSGILTATTNLTITSPLLQSIEISPTSLDLTAGTSSRFAVKATFDDNTTQDVTTSSSWSSNNALIATAGDSGIAKGQVTGVAAATGSTTINAAYGALTVAAPVTVNKRTIRDLAILGTTTLASGNQVKFTTNASYTDGTSKDVTEDTVWSIATSNVAILADGTNQPGQVVGVDGGLATLTAVFGGMTQTATITVH